MKNGGNKQYFLLRIPDLSGVTVDMGVLWRDGVRGSYWKRINRFVF